MSPSSTRARRIRALSATITATVLAVSSLLLAAPASAASAALPDVIPSISGWQSAEGVFTAADDLAIVADPDDAGLTSAADILRSELAAGHPGAKVVGADTGAGDIELRIDDGRDDLGDQGYQLTVGDSIVVTGADRAGVFNGTRTVLQMLTQQDTLPRGSVVDVPEYAERGVTVCACVINISTEFMDRLIEDMAYLKMNTLMLELKVKVDGYPQTNTWSYYTKDDIRALVKKANRYGIDVIPEINSPGHMEIWLENMPELQLTNESTGAKDEVRMDITKDASFDFYTDLIDEYADVFTTKYWHMGADEYMLGSGYKNYPQIKRFAEEKFGAGATENDVVAWYTNKVNAYVKSKGKTMRIWNDGVMTDNKFVRFDTDIIIEHWNQAGSTIKPQQFIDWGHEVNNISNSLYMVRGGYGVDSKGLYEGGWTPAQFYGQKVTGGTDKILGARMSIWPDGGTPAEAENTTEKRMLEPLRLVAQTTWTNDRPWKTYADFKKAMDVVGRAPLWENADRQPLPSGAYTLQTEGGALAAGAGSGTALADAGDTFTFTRTDDGYYTIRAADGRCLDLSRAGTMRLNVPVEIGADVTLANCATTTLQKWQVREADGGYTVANAASQQFLSISKGLKNVPVAYKGFKDVADGRVVQTPADWGRTVWKADGDVSLAVSPAAVSAAPGGSGTFTVTISNMTDRAVAGATLRVRTADGWTAVPAEVAVGDVASHDSVDAEAKVFNIAAEIGTGVFGFDLVDGDGKVVAHAETPANATCAAVTLQPKAIAAVSSQQLSGEPAPNGPAAAAIDGNPATYWHSQWSPTTATYPHSIVLDLGEAQAICGLWHTGRSSTGTGGANGRIGDYEVYASQTVSAIDGDWGAPVAKGAFQNSASAQLASFAPQPVRYLKLVALSEVNGNPWATAGELAAAGPVIAPPTYQASVSAGGANVRAGTAVKVTGSGFAPGEPVAVTLRKQGPGTVTALGSLTADGEGRVSGEVTVPADSAGGPHLLIATGTLSKAADDTTIKVREIK
ncbi:MAG: family 20 glycosylhydrolase [Microbacterium sp.]|nr:family 20 glycosylhydrolase [Microbacterium sp.]